MSRGAAFAMKTLESFILAAFFLLLGPNTRTGAQPSSKWFSVPYAKLCVTEGAIEQASGNRMSVNVPKMRALLTMAATQDVEAHFTYLKKAQEKSRLAPARCAVSWG